MAGLPPGIDLNDNQQPQIIGSVISTWAIALIVVVLRFVSRRMSKAGWWVDDYLMLPALVLSTILSWVSITWMIEYNLGRHIFILPLNEIPKAVEVFFKCLFISEFCYTWIIVTVKFSILAFYWRLFSRDNRVKWPVLVLGVVTCVWGIAVFLIVVLQCRPLRGFWDKTIEAACTVDSRHFFYGNSIPNIITDMALMIVPLPAIWGLQLNIKQKVMLMGIFLVGIFVTVVSCVRLSYLVTLDATNPDFTWNFGVTQIWTCVELNVAIVCGCLPQLRPVIGLVAKQVTNFTSRGGSVANEDRSNLYRSQESKRSHRKNNASVTVTAGDEGWDKLSDVEMQSPPITRSPLQSPQYNAQSPHSRSQTALPAGGINVRRDFDVRWQPA